MTSTTATARTNADLAAEVARPRVTAFHRARGIYPVTVGGIIIGQVERHPVATSKNAVTWSATTDTGEEVAFGQTTRTDAVDLLARTDGAVQAYREAAHTGAFGTAEQTRMRVELDAQLAAADALAEDDEEPDREPSAEQERAWDTREDDARGHALTADGVAAGDVLTADLPQGETITVSQPAPAAPTLSVTDLFRAWEAAQERFNRNTGTYAALRAARQALRVRIAELAKRARATGALIADIRASYPVTDGRDGFLSDPGGWIAYLGLTDDDALAAAAIAAIRAEVAGPTADQS